MSEHLIDQLLHKAGARFGAEGIDYSDFTSSKFAELIVRECIDTAFHKGHPDLEFLLKHFGIE